MTSPPPELNVIACQRCRHKKIRCGRERPTCKRCCQVSEACVYDAPRYGKRKHGAISGSLVNPSTSNANSYIPGILSRLDALESVVRNTTSPFSPQSINSSNPSPCVPQNTVAPSPNILSEYPHTKQMKGYKVRVDPAANALDEMIVISLEMALSWIHTLYDAQSALGLLLPISKDFMLTIPSIIDNPYVQVDVRVVILYYGALHHGMLLSSDLSIAEKNKYALFFYRKTLKYMGQWLLQDNVNELSLHVAFWMTHEAYSQLDFDLSHRLHGHACQIARDLGLLHLDAENRSSSLSSIFSQPLRNPRWPLDTIGTVYRDVHRIYFWHILITNDFSFRHHLYRSSNIESGTWKVDIPDYSTRQSLSDIKSETKVYFEASLRLSVIELKYSELTRDIILRKSADCLVNESEKVKIKELLLEIHAVLNEANIVSLLNKVSSKVIAWLCVHLIWRATSMTVSFLRIQPRSAVWPAESEKHVEHAAALRSIQAMQRLFDFNQDGLYWNLGYFQCFFTPCLGVLFGTILTTASQRLAADDLALTLWVQTVVSRCAEGRHELKSLEMLLQTLNHYSHLRLLQIWPSFRSNAEPHLDCQSTPTATKDLRPTESLSHEKMHEDEIEFLDRYGISIAQLSTEPFQTVLSLEKCILTEADPHRLWWTFESLTLEPEELS